LARVRYCTESSARQRTYRRLFRHELTFGILMSRASGRGIKKHL
jgi:hypothetical protein